MRTPLHSLPHPQRGAEVAEFVLTLPVFFLVFFMVVDFAITLFDQGTITTASRIGTRQATLFWNDPDLFDPTTPLLNRRVKKAMVDSVVTWAEVNLLIKPGSSGLTADFEVNGATVTGATQVIATADVVGVNITYPHTFIGLMAFAGLSGLSMGAESTLVVE